jgi:hypothetical protein
MAGSTRFVQSVNRDGWDGSRAPAGSTILWHAFACKLVLQAASKVLTVRRPMPIRTRSLATWSFRWRAEWTTAYVFDLLALQLIAWDDRIAALIYVHACIYYIRFKYVINILLDTNIFTNYNTWLILAAVVHDLQLIWQTLSYTHKFIHSLLRWSWIDHRVRCITVLGWFGSERELTR